VEMLIPIQQWWLASILHAFPSAITPIQRRIGRQQQEASSQWLQDRRILKQSSNRHQEIRPGYVYHVQGHVASYPCQQVVRSIPDQGALQARSRCIQAHRKESVQ